jgi:hypothetical protein
MLLTATTMGGEKFHITVTIDIEKSLADCGFREFSFRNILFVWNSSKLNRSDEKNRLPTSPHTAFQPAILLSCSAIKGGSVVGFLFADICANAPAL